MKKVSKEDEHEEFSQQELGLIGQIGIRAITHLGEVGIIIDEDCRIDFCEMMYEVLGEMIKLKGANTINSEEEKEMLARHFAAATLVATEILVDTGFSDN